MARKIIIFVNGYPRAGKSTFVAASRSGFAAHGWRTTESSIVDIPLQMLETAEVDISNKTPPDRALMAALVVALESHDRFLSRRIVSDAHIASKMATGSFIAFVHAREPAAINFMVKRARELGFEAITAFVDRPNEDREWSNAADANVENFTYDMLVKNSGSLSELVMNTSGFVKAIIEGASNA